jgi:hypothetical protein
MDVFVCDDHAGHWPVGVCSIVIAHSEHEARGLLKAELHEHGLDESKPFTLRRLSMEKPKAFVIRDGDY